MSQPKNNKDFNVVNFPPKLLEKIYESSGGPEVGHGYFLCYIDDKGDPFYVFKAQSKIIELGLMSCLTSIIKGISIESNKVDSDEDSILEIGDE